MKESRFMILTILYIVIAAVFTFKFGPDFIRKMDDVGITYHFKEVSSMELTIRMEHEGKSFVLGNKVYDSLPIKIAYDTTNRKPKYIEVDMLLDSLKIHLAYDAQNPSEKWERLINILNARGLLDSTKDYKVQLPKKLSAEKLRGMNVKLILNKAGDFDNRSNFVSINDIHIYGVDSSFRYLFGKIAAYFITIISGFTLLLITINGVIQFINHQINGNDYYVPSWAEGIKELTQRLTKRNK
ncbi:hypothetical protein [Maribacter luteus]|uniref:Uncharacterized protein n=1 Tax=Maribacter luteus TaxID=2594478 RepID=A0A6I2MGK9_9FLAO|nr:hypothetical protein [Maribacter luteus]MRX62933.1 hypothetical protein [Maribacter luteus]